MSIFRRLALPFWSILIAIVLWIQVHGQGMGSLRMDVALQVRDVPIDMAIVNDLPDQVSITVTGLQSQLNSLDAQSLFVSVDASALNMPGVIEQALDVEAIDLPVGLKVEKIQPDTVQLQVDHIVKRTIDITPIFDLPQGWKVSHVIITPSVIELSGPEVWLSTISKIETTALRLDLAQGNFDVETEVIPLSEKGIHALKKDLKIRVRGQLIWEPVVEEAQAKGEDASADKYGKAKTEPAEKSIVPVPAVEKKEANEPLKNIEPIKEIKPQAEVITLEPKADKRDSIVPIPAEVYSQPSQKEAVSGEL